MQFQVTFSLPYDNKSSNNPAGAMKMRVWWWWACEWAKSFRGNLEEFLSVGKFLECFRTTFFPIWHLVIHIPSNGKEYVG
jgi:hypothetical protein